MENKTIEIYSYEDNSQKTNITIKSLVTNKTISIKFYTGDNKMTIKNLKSMEKAGN